MDLKFSGFIFDGDSNNPAKFREGSIAKICISKNRDFQNFDL